MSDKPKQDEQKTERFNMFMSPSEMKAIDDWAWENKIRSKSEAVRRLVQIGLQADETYKLLQDQIEAAVKQRVQGVTQVLFDNQPKSLEDLLKNYQLLLDAQINGIKSFQRLTELAFRASEQSGAMRGDGEIESLIAEAKKIKDEYKIPKSLADALFSQRKSDE